MAKVYIKIDEARRIIDIGSDVFLPSVDGYELLDEGEGDRYVHAQGNYLDLPVMTEQGVPRYKLADGKTVLRTPEEIAADVAALPKPPEPAEARVADLEAQVAALQRELIGL